MEKEVEIRGQKLKIKELNYLDIVETNSINDVRKRKQRQLELSGVPTELSGNLTVHEGVIIANAMNEVNAWVSDFQETSSKESTQ